MSCKTCQHFDVEPDAAGRIVIRKKRGYRCLAPEPPLPACITSRFDYRWPPARWFVTADGGIGCPCFEPRQKR